MNCHQERRFAKISKTTPKEQKNVETKIITQYKWCGYTSKADQERTKPRRICVMVELIN